MDAMIEMRQRFPEQRVVLFSSREHMPEWVLGPGTLMTRAYHLQDTVAVQPRLTADELRTACAARATVCYEPNFDAAAFDDMVGPARPCLHPLDLLNTNEARCFRCDPAACAAG